MGCVAALFRIRNKFRAVAQQDRRHDRNTSCLLPLVLTERLAETFLRDPELRKAIATRLQESAPKPPRSGPIFLEEVTRRSISLSVLTIAFCLKIT